MQFAVLETFDQSALHVVNHWIGSSHFLWLHRSGLLELGEKLIACAIVGLWFSSRLNVNVDARKRLILFAVACIPALMFARAIQSGIHRERPILYMALETSIDKQSLEQFRAVYSRLGSFPSDHATLLALFVTMTYSLNKGVAMAGIAWFVVDSVLRIGMGVHWLSDLAGGVGLGFTVAAGLIALESFLEKPVGAVLAQFEKRPAASYILAFLALLEFSTGFDHAKKIAMGLFHVRLFH